jgi:hypothetical protein
MRERLETLVILITILSDGEARLQQLAPAQPTGISRMYIPRMRVPFCPLLSLYEGVEHDGDNPHQPRLLCGPHG